MTPQEQQLLTQLAQRVNQTQLQEKDPDAENLLGKELSANPDAIYILAQTVLVQDITLQRANSHISDLEKQNDELQAELQEEDQQLQQLQQRQQPAKATSFLGRIFGDPQTARPPQAQYQQAAPPYQPVQYAPQAPQYAAPQYVPASAPMAAPAGQPSFLRSAMQTAAGVAAGSLAFQGIESLMHGGFGGGRPEYGGGYGGGFGGERPTEEVVNNYYGDSPEHHHEGGGQFQNTAYDSGDRSYDDGSGAQFSDASFNDDSTYGNSGGDSSYDDSGSYDDSNNV